MTGFDDLVEGYEGIAGPLADPAADAGPLSDEEHQKMEELLVAPEDRGPAFITIDPSDWPGPPPEPEPLPEMRPLRPDQIPRVGHHYVIFNGKPCPVVRENYAVSEDEHVRTNMGDSSAHYLKDPDGLRQQRAARTLRMRYRGYLCGELQGL